jgi:bifunctional aspartokinase / homoserine dehydrogenase 1
MKVMKFGGSSLADSERIRSVAAIVREEMRHDPVAVVLSAMKGVTDSLISAARSAELGDRGYREAVESLRQRHTTTVEELIPSTRPERDGALTTIIDLISELTDLLHGVELIRECSPRTMDLVLSFGERLNCSTVAAFLTSQGDPAEFVDAREMIVTDTNHGSAVVDYTETYQRTAARVHRCAGIPVITGFIATSSDGFTTTLGRNGSDYTASLVGAAISASAVEIWTDVDGVMSADPRYVENAFVIPEISLEEAMELSYFGAEVIHPYTMIPAVEKEIPLWIKNTLNPPAPGTRISGHAVSHDRDITGIASIENVALINVEGGGMLGIPGMASRVFGALARANVNVIMISQASSEHSICICIRESELQRASHFLREELRDELAQRRIDQFEEQDGLEIVAVIGGNMRGRPGISGRLFSALGEKKVNVLAIAQGSSEMNISFIIDRTDRRHALNVVHDAFFAS